MLHGFLRHVGLQTDPISSHSEMVWLGPLVDLMWNDPFRLISMTFDKFKVDLLQFLNFLLASAAS